MSASDRKWSTLTRLQLGKYAEYFVKMELVLAGFDVFTAEVDDRGIDFVIRTAAGRHYDVQVKSFRLSLGRGTPYVFMQQMKFRPCADLLLALVQFVDGESPRLFLVPSCESGSTRPNALLEDRRYDQGQKSEPEWGLTLSKKKLSRIHESCSFHDILRSLA